MTPKITLTKSDSIRFPEFQRETQAIFLEAKHEAVNVFGVPEDFIFRKGESELIHMVCFKRNLEPAQATQFEINLLCTAHNSLNNRFPSSAQPFNSQTKNEIKQFADAINTIGSIAKKNKTLVKQFATRAAHYRHKVEDPDPDGAKNEYRERLELLCNPEFYESIANKLWHTANVLPIGEGTGKTKSSHVLSLLSDFYSVWHKSPVGEFTTSPRSYCYKVAMVYLRLCELGISEFREQMKKVKDAGGQLNFITARGGTKTVNASLKSPST